MLLLLEIVLSNFSTETEGNKKISKLLAPKVLLEYLSPMITNPISSHPSHPEAPASTTTPSTSPSLASLVSTGPNVPGGSDQMKKAHKKLALSKIDFLSSGIIIGLD